MPQSKYGAATTRLGMNGALSSLVGPAVGIADVVGEHGRSPLDLAGDGTRVRVEQQLRRVAAVALVRRPRAVDAEAVALAGAHPRHVAVPAMTGRFREVDVGLVALVVEQASSTRVGDFGEEREVGPVGIERDAERLFFTGPDRTAHREGAARRASRISRMRACASRTSLA